jgi:transcriptional regulator with XRE-family HTH domain
MEAVAKGLKSYRDGNNPDRRHLSDSELARRLGVSKSTLSKYLQTKQLIGGEPLARMLTDLAISLSWGDKTLVAQNSEPAGVPQPSAEQICFVFDRPCFVEETPERVGVAMATSFQGSRVTVHLKVAG